MRPYTEARQVHLKYVDRHGRTQSIPCPSTEVAQHVMANMKARMPQLYFTIV